MKLLAIFLFLISSSYAQIDSSSVTTGQAIQASKIVEIIDAVNTNTNKTIETCYVKDVKVGTGGTATSGGFLPRVLNTLEGQCSFASLSNGTTGLDGTATDLTLQSGSYNIECSSAFSFVVNDIVTIFRNVTDNQTEIVSMNRRSGSADDNVNSSMMGNVTIGSSKTFQLQYRVGTTRSADGLGQSIYFGENHVFAQCKITKVN